MATYSVALESDGRYLSRMGSNASRALTGASVGTGSGLSSQTAIPIISPGLERSREEAGAHRPDDGRHRERCLDGSRRLDFEEPGDPAGERRRREAEAGQSIQHPAGISMHLPRGCPLTHRGRGRRHPVPMTSFGEGHPSLPKDPRNSVRLNEFDFLL